MHKHSGPVRFFLLLAGLACIGGMVYFSRQAYQSLTAAEADLNSAIDNIEQNRQYQNKEKEILSETIASAKDALKKEAAKEDAVKEETAKEDAAKEETAKEDAVQSEPSKSETEPDAAPEESLPDGILENEGTISPPKHASSPSDDSSFSNGHIVGIDPGHQGYSVDMSDLEPLGPGSSEMKAKASTGTQGTYSGLPEYQLNLDVSLKLRDILENRGYEVIMTRTDNETAISNKERAEYVAQMGAEIYVRIHANGDDTHTASGALGMVPSPDNPFVGGLSGESRRLSQCILDSYCAATGFKSLGVSYYDDMTGINWSTIPVTILEMGFMTYESEDLQMSDAAFQDIMAEGIADGIDAYFK